MQEQRQTIYTSHEERGGLRPHGGLSGNAQMREQCQRVLRGEVTTAELLRRGAQGSSAWRIEHKKRMAAAILFLRYRWYSNSRSYILTMSPS